MKYILIALAFNLQITYPDLEVCQEARDILRAEAPLGQAGNILCIPARFISEDEQKDLFETFIYTEFQGGRHKRRVDKINC